MTLADFESLLYIAFSPMLPAMTLLVIPTTLGWYAPNYYSNVQTGTVGV